MSTPPKDPNDPRLGVPPDKFGLHAIPLQTADRRQAVLMMIFPPEELRDAPYELVRDFIFSRSAALLRSIAQEIHQAYTSEPLEAAPVQNIITALQGHVDAQKRDGR